MDQAKDPRITKKEKKKIKIGNSMLCLTRIFVGSETENRTHYVSQFTNG